MKINKLILLASALAAALPFAGCSPKEARALERSAEAKLPPWNWEEYPPVTKMRLGVLSCVLQPKSSITMVSPLSGTLKLYVHSPQTNLPANTLWAEFEPEIFAAEEKSLADAARKLEDREKLEWEVEYPRRKMQLEKQLEEAQRQLTWMRMVATNKHLADLMFSGPNGSALRPDSLSKTELEVKLLQQSLNYVLTTNLAATGVDLEGERSELERRKLEFERRRAQSRFKMPFSGRLTLNLSLSDGVSEYAVTAGQELGVARDMNAVRVRVPVENVAWSSLPAEKISAVVRAGEDVFHASFAYQKIERVQNREETVYYFEIPAEHSARAGKLVGANVSCELWLNLWEPVRVVPKLALVLRKPDAFQNESWAWALNHLFPGSRLVVEGQTDLAVAPPQEIKLSSK